VTAMHASMLSELYIYIWVLRKSTGSHW